MRKTLEVAKILIVADKVGMKTSLLDKIKFLASIHKKERKGEYNAIRSHL